MGSDSIPHFSYKLDCGSSYSFLLFTLKILLKSDHFPLFQFLCRICINVESSFSISVTEYSLHRFDDDARLTHSGREGVPQGVVTEGKGYILRDRVRKVQP